LRSAPSSVRLATLALVLLAAALAATFAFSSSPSGDAVAEEMEVYRKWREALLLRRSEVAPRGGALLLGDSIAEQSALTEYCGKPLFNAAISATGITQTEPLARQLIPRLRPQIVVVAGGVNDARRGGSTPLAEWEKAYEALLAHARARSVVVVVGIMPIEEGKPAGTAVFDPRAMAERNRSLERLAKKHGAQYLAPLPALQTYDGVHPNAQGAIAWAGHLQSLCPALAAKNP
jgi:hypothetical protein